MANKEIVTIGLLTSMIWKDIFQDLWWGVMDAGRDNGVSVICFPGGEPGDPTSSADSQANAIYDLASTECLDGLIIWSSVLGWHTNEQEMLDFIRPFRHLPIVTIEVELEGIPTVLLTEYEGIRELMAHLVEKHNYQRIAHIRGPGEDEENAIYRAYKEALDEYRLFDPKLVTPPVDWSQENGAAMIELLLDKRGLQSGIDFEAILAADDALALGAIGALQARGIHVPHEVAVVGFDDTPNARSVTPPLTTVRHSYYDVGRQAVELLLGEMGGKKMPEETYLPAELVIRQSCGCLEVTVTRAAVGSVLAVDEPLEIAMTKRENEILAAMGQAIGKGRAELIQEGAEELLHAFRTDLMGQTAGAFLLVLDDILRQVIRTGSKVATWQGVISVLHQQTFPYFISRESLLQAESLWQQARVMIGKAAERAQRYRVLQAEQRAQMLREVGQTLITTFDVKGVMDVLAEGLPRLGIPSCYLSMYENPQPYAYPQPVPEWSRLMLAYREVNAKHSNGRIELASDGLRFPSRQLVPQGLLSQERSYTMIVEPLHFRQQQIGFVVFETGPREGVIYDTLRGEISNALYGAQLYTEALQARAVAEKADQLKTRLLANVSHELRTPLNVILGHTRIALNDPNPYTIELPPALRKDLQHIHDNAAHQIRVINDLLDLSRAEIDELDLYPELLDTHTFLEDVFCSMADRADNTSQAVTWQIQLPERLPVIEADPVRLRQILLNLLSNARKFTEQGQILLGADVTPPHLHIWVQDTGCGIPTALQQRIFEPFTTLEQTNQRLGGIGLGLTISRRLVALHRGSMKLESKPGQGSIFHVYLPLPNLSDRPISLLSTQPVLLLISSRKEPTSEIVELSQRQGLEIRRVGTTDGIDKILAEVQPVALAWDLAGARDILGEWAIIQQLRKHPHLSQAPFILYGQQQVDEHDHDIGITNLIVKPVDGQTLIEAIKGLQPRGDGRPILIIDDDPDARTFFQTLVIAAFPQYPVRTANDGKAALTIMTEETPSLVVLDLMMPEMDGFEVLEWIRTHRCNRQVPVLVLSNRTLTFEDVKRLEQYTRVTVQSKGILSQEETVDTMQRALLNPDALPPQTSTLVKRTIVYFHQNYYRLLSRQEMASAIGVSEDYLGRVFRQEVGLSPWEFLNRYRVKQAKELLRQTDHSVTTVAHKVGFTDSAYFSRVFRKLVGQSPRAYRGHTQERD